MNEVRHGNKDAFGKLYQDIKVPVYTIIWRIVRNTSVAEEIMQELFLKIYVSPPDENVNLNFRQTGNAIVCDYS